MALATVPLAPPLKLTVSSAAVVEKPKPWMVKLVALAANSPSWRSPRATRLPLALRRRCRAVDGHRCRQRSAGEHAEAGHRQRRGRGGADGSGRAAAEGNDVVGRRRASKPKPWMVKVVAVDARARRACRRSRGITVATCTGLGLLRELPVTVAVRLPRVKPFRPVTVSVVAVALVTVPVAPC